MGSYSSKPDPDPSFLHESGHKTYVVTSSHMEFVKIGYTGQTLHSGVWSTYRRAYGEDLEIIRMYPARHYKEDDLIHAKLHPKYGIAAKGKEIYHKKHLKNILKELDDWHETGGIGPFTRLEVLSMGVENRQKAKKKDPAKTGSSKKNSTKIQSKNTAPRKKTKVKANRTVLPEEKSF